VLELKRNLFVLQRWWWLLVLGALIGGVVAYGLTNALVQNQYQAVAVVSSGSAPQGEHGTYFASFGSGGDGTLLANQGVLTGVQRLVPEISRTQLVSHLTGTASEQDCVSLDSASAANQCRLLSLRVQWPDPASAIRLANALATVFMQQERTRLEQGYTLFHRGIVVQEQSLTRLVRSTPGKGAAQNWLQAQYANTLSDLYGKDANARIQSSIAETSLQVAQPATTAVKVAGPKALVNTALGALVGLLIAWVIASIATSSYGDEVEVRGPRAVLTKAND
jgi:capsular polysaccharide biosynthesis protein